MYDSLVSTLNLAFMDKYLNLNSKDNEILNYLGLINFAVLI